MTDSRVRKSLFSIGDLQLSLWVDKKDQQINTDIKLTDFRPHRCHSLGRSRTKNQQCKINFNYISRGDWESQQKLTLQSLELIKNSNMTNLLPLQNPNIIESHSRILLAENRVGQVKDNQHFMLKIHSDLNETMDRRSYHLQNSKNIQSLDHIKTQHSIERKQSRGDSTPRTPRRGVSNLSYYSRTNSKTKIPEQKFQLNPEINQGFSLKKTFDFGNILNLKLNTSKQMARR